MQDSNRGSGGTGGPGRADGRPVPSGMQGTGGGRRRRAISAG